MTALSVRIGEVSEQIRGVTYGKDDASDTAQNGYFPILRAGNITDTGVLFDDLVYVPEDYVSQKQLLRSGDVLIAASSGSLDVVGKAASLLSDYEGAFGAFCKVLRPDQLRVDARYFAHFFKTVEYRRIVSRLAAGANINNLRNEHLNDLLIPLPPLPEQRRIAAILDKADALRTKRREALAQLDRLAQSIFVEMFGDPMSAGSPWTPVPVSQFVAGFESGKSVAADDEDDVTSQYRVLKVSAVTSLEFKPNESKAAPPDYAPQNSHFVRAGDLLFSRANTTELIGATAFVTETPANLLLPDKLWRFVWHEQPRATPHFVNYLFRQSKFRAEIGRRASGSSGSMKNISQEKVLSIDVALPPMNLQETFSKRITKVMRMKAGQIPTQEYLKDLFSALQYRAFRGEL